MFFAPRRCLLLKDLPVGRIGSRERCIASDEDSEGLLISHLLCQKLPDFWIGVSDIGWISESGVTVHDQLDRSAPGNSGNGDCGTDGRRNLRLHKEVESNAGAYR